MFENLLSWLLLPLGVALGLGLARKRNEGHADSFGSSAPGSRLGQGTAHDDASSISSLSKAAEADPAVIELQMTLGSLFRKRGEVERAINLHESVLARPMLDPKQVAQARHELAQDYLRAGLMDRAETLLHELVASGDGLAPALELLLDLYEQGRDWSQAIATAGRLESVLGSSLAPRISQYICELAETAVHTGNADLAAKEAERALDADRNCVRASLILAGLAEKRSDWISAIRAYRRAADQDRRYLSEIISPLQRCYVAAEDANGYRQFLDDALADHPDSGPLVLARAEQIRGEGKDATSYLATRLSKKPEWRSLLLWIGDQTSPDDTEAGKVLDSLRKRLEARPRYACSACGLAPSVLFWQCPSCKQWATIVPSPDTI